MAITGQIKITLCEDGSVKLDSSQCYGTEAEILAELKELATVLGGQGVVVEKHVHKAGAHHHHHGDGRMHSH